MAQCPSPGDSHHSTSIRLLRNFVEKCCTLGWRSETTVLERVLEKSRKLSCGGVLEKSVGDNSWRRVLERFVEKCWRRVL